MLVRSAGPACHTGNRTCFYRVLENSVNRIILKVDGTWSSAVLRDRQSKVFPEVGCGDLSEAEEAWPENVDIDINMVKMNL